MTNENNTPAMLIYQPATEKPSVRSVLLKKYLTWLEVSPTTKILTVYGRVVLALSGAFAVWMPGQTWQSVTYIVSHGWPVILSVTITEGVFQRKKIMRLFRKVRNGQNQNTLEGCPKTELLHFLFEKRGLPMNETIELLGVSRRRFDRLARKLEEIGVLVRGPNNARVLSPLYSREQVKEIIWDAQDASEISQPVIIGNLQDASPAGKARRVEEMIEEDDSPAPAPFVIRPVRSA